MLCVLYNYLNQILFFLKLNNLLDKCSKQFGFYSLTRVFLINKIFTHFNKIIIKLSFPKLQEKRITFFNILVKNFVGAQKFGNQNGKKCNRIILNRKKEQYLNSKPQVVPTKIADLEQHMALFKLGELKLSVCLLTLFKNHWQIRVAVLGYHISVCKMNTT